MQSVCVYCGSSPGRRTIYAEQAEQLGRTLAQRDIRLVYGGARVGIMGVIADAVLTHGGEVVGVIPQPLVDLEVAHEGLSELIITRSMHERKAIMAEHADAFIALPGGIGTLEELFEAWTWTQLGFHRKPCGLLNIDGYYDHLIRFLDHIADQAFVKTVHRDILCVDSQAEGLLEQLASFQPLKEKKWIERSEL